MKDANERLSSVELNGKIYVFGGISGTNACNTVEQYDTSTGKWSSRAPMPGNAAEARTAVINGMIYIVDGFQNYAGPNNDSNNVYIYNPASNVWTTTKHDIGRIDHQVAVVNGKLYIIGGRENNGRTMTPTVEMYDPNTNTWVRKASMNTARAYFSVEVVNGKIYAFGGCSSNSSKVYELNTAEQYDPETDTWTFIEPMNLGRHYHKSVVLNNKIYIIGGQTSNSGNTGYVDSNRVDEYDPSTNTWTTKAPLNNGRYWYELVVYNGTIYCIGGRSNTSAKAISVVEKYDPKTNTWEVKNPMIEGRWCFAACISNNAIYAIGGLTGSSSLSSAEKYTLPVVVPVAPSALTAAGGDTKVDLSWGTVTGATGYKVMRSTTAGGPYAHIATGVTATTYTDSTVTNGTTYYYVVTALNTAGESANSNEASATPKKTDAGNAILEIYMVDGALKEYDLSMDKVNAFIDWYDAKATGAGKSYYVFDKNYNKGPFKARKEYIVFDKIKDFQVNQYD